MVEVKIYSFVATDHQLCITVEVPALNNIQATFYRRHGYGPLAQRWGWYCNDSGGSLPDQERLAPVLNKLVMEHPALRLLADNYGVVADYHGIGE